MNNKLTLYGWHLSYFTGKVLCYLRYKQIPFVDQPVNMWTLMWQGKRKTGEVVMPILVTSEGEWVQDSSVIIDRMEALFPAAPVVPSTPVQRFAAYLLEAWGDEWWVPIAMHTRWTYPENYALFEHDAGTSLLPHFPAFMQRRAAAQVAEKLRGFLHTVGVRSEQFDVMDRWTGAMLDLLDQHFSTQPFLLGASPTIGDVGLVGTMYGHLGRDPWPARELIAPRRHLHAWLARMANPDLPGAHQAGAGLLADDQIAPTLAPVLRAIFQEFMPMVEAINRQVKDVLISLPKGKALPRRLQDIEVPMGDGRFCRVAIPYTLWMAQRTLDAYDAMNADEKAQVRAWLATLGGEGFLALDIPRLRRRGLRVMPA